MADRDIIANPPSLANNITNHHPIANGAAAAHPCRLLPQHLADLHRSGLTDAYIAACGFRSGTDSTDIGKLLRWQNYRGQLGPVLVIPYRDATGKYGKYARIKPDKP